METLGYSISSKIYFDAIEKHMTTKELIALADKASGRDIIGAGLICVHKSYTYDPNFIQGIAYLILNCTNTEMVFHAKKVYILYVENRI